jgi:3-methylfumaryl-CoA hydratase
MTALIGSKNTMNDDFSAWLGRQEEASDVLEPARTNALRAALGTVGPLAAGAPLPPLYHWLYFWNVEPPGRLGPDGHPAKGGFLPPVPLPRRMWAGGRLQFLKPLLIGEQVTRTSTILKVEAKSGKSGNLVFVTIEHRLAGKQGEAIIEEQDLVYREPATQGATPAPQNGAAVPNASWHSEIQPNTVLLFRYSALTMNSHRIHYDRPYTVDVESYPSLVVHGPLQATLLADLAVRKLKSPITSFDFRGQSPALDIETLHVCGEPTEGGATLWTEQNGAKNMVATVTCGLEE